MAESEMDRMMNEIVRTQRNTHDVSYPWQSGPVVRLTPTGTRAEPSQEEVERRMLWGRMSFRNMIAVALDRAFLVGIEYPTHTSIQFPLDGTGDCRLLIEVTTEIQVERGPNTFISKLTLQNGDGNRFSDVNWGYTNAGRSIGPFTATGADDPGAEVVAEVRRLFAVSGRVFDRTQFPPQKTFAERRNALRLNQLYDRDPDQDSEYEFGGFAE